MSSILNLTQRTELENDPSTYVYAMTSKQSMANPPHNCKIVVHMIICHIRYVSLSIPLRGNVIKGASGRIVSLQGMQARPSIHFSLIIGPRPHRGRRGWVYPVFSIHISSPRVCAMSAISDTVRRKLPWQTFTTTASCLSLQASYLLLSFWLKSLEQLELLCVHRSGPQQLNNPDNSSTNDYPQKFPIIFFFFLLYTARTYVGRLFYGTRTPISVWATQTRRHDSKTK